MAGYTNERSCTDILFLILFILFWIGMIVVGAIAFSSGDPRRLYHGTDSEGNVCGLGDAPKGLSDEEWTKMEYAWYPIVPDSISTDGDASLSSVAQQVEDILKLGICVTECPLPSGETLSPNYYQADYMETKIAWPVYYESTKVFQFCVPKLVSDLNSEDVKEFLTQFNSTASLEGVMKRGHAELVAAADVIAIGFALSFVISLVIIVLMRFVAKVIVYIVLIAFLLFLVACGILLFTQRSETDNDTYKLGFIIAAIICWVIAGLYVLLVIFMWRNIQISVEIIEMSSQVMGAVRTLILVPPIMLAVLVGVTVWCIFVWAYLETAAELKTEKLIANVKYVNITDEFSEQYEVVTKYLSHPAAGSWLQLYNLFGYLWSVAFLNAIGFMVIAFCAVKWYFSEPGDHKSVPHGCLVRSFWWTFRYHMGTLAFGSLIVAIIQFIRFLLARVQKKLESKATGGDPVTQAARCLLCCVQCCLACWERIVKFISQNAYIVCCMESSSFCRSTVKAMQLIISNIALVGASNFLMDATLVICKLCIVVVNMFITWLLITRTPLGEDVEFALFPMIIIGIVSYIVASVYMHIYDTVQDTLLLCFCYDKDMNNGQDKPYYFTQDLSKILDKYNQKLAEKQSKNKIVPAESTNTH